MAEKKKSHAGNPRLKWRTVAKSMYQKNGTA